MLQDVKIGAKIGEGNFGEVYKGEWAASAVALKKLNSGEIESFQREASILW